MKKTIYTICQNRFANDWNLTRYRTEYCFLSEEKAERFACEMNENTRLKDPFKYYVEESFILDFNESEV